MNYLSIYNKIISRAQLECRRKRKCTDPKYVYYEKHHILPKCLGGSDDKANLVFLTGREHFTTHQLLVKIYPEEYKLVFALRSLCERKNKNHVRNNKEYSWIRKLHAEKMSLLQRGKPGKGYKFPKGHTLSVGENNGMYGKTHTKETRNIQSEKAKERDPSFYNFARLPKTDLHKKNMRKSRQVCRYVLTDPAGKEYIFDRIADASKFCGISNSVLVKLAGNRYGFDHCRYWKICAVECQSSSSSP